MDEYDIPFEHYCVESQRKILKEIHEPVSPTILIGEKVIAGFSPRFIKQYLIDEIDKEKEMKSNPNKKNKIEDKGKKRGMLPKINSKEIESVPDKFFRGEIVDEYVDSSLAKMQNAKKFNRPMSIRHNALVEKLSNKFGINKDKIEEWVDDSYHKNGKVNDREIIYHKPQKFLK